MCCCCCCWHEANTYLLFFSGHFYFENKLTGSLLITWTLQLYCEQMNESLKEAIQRSKTTTITVLTTQLRKQAENTQFNIWILIINHSHLLFSYPLNRCTRACLIHTNHEDMNPLELTPSSLYIQDRIHPSLGLLW